MSAQKFYADPNQRFEFSNGAIGYRPGGTFDCLGPYAKVTSCPVRTGDGATALRLTCYATGYADTFFSVPACTRHKGKYISGFFTVEDGAITFCVLDKHKGRVS